MTEFEIVFVVFSIGACIVGAIQLTIAYRSSTRDVEPDPEHIRRFVERGMELRQKAQEKAPETEKARDGVTESQAADHPTPRADSD